MLAAGKSVMVLSVGNLTVGGTGKTPVVEKLAREKLQMRSATPAITSYATYSAGTVVSAGGVLFTSAPEVIATAGAAMSTLMLWLA